MNYFFFKSRARAFDYSMNDEDKEFFHSFFLQTKLLLIPNQINELEEKNTVKFVNNWRNCWTSRNS